MRRSLAPWLLLALPAGSWPSPALAQLARPIAGAARSMAQARWTSPAAAQPLAGVSLPALTAPRSFTGPSSYAPPLPAQSPGAALSAQVPVEAPASPLPAADQDAPKPDQRPAAAALKAGAEELSSAQGASQRGQALSRLFGEGSRGLAAADSGGVRAGLSAPRPNALSSASGSKDGAPSADVPLSAQAPGTYAEFWPYYLSQHAKPGTRLWHVSGTLLGLGLAGALLAFGYWFLIPLAFVPGYGFSWTGHFFVEKNRPASWGGSRFFLWSFVSDFRMLGHFLTGTLRRELGKYGIGPN